MKANGSTTFENKLKGNNTFENFRAKNLEDFISTIENHKLSWDQEIVIVEFDNSLKLRQRQGAKDYGIFLNDIYNQDTANELPEIMLNQGAFVAEIYDTSTNQAVPVFGHQDLLKYSDLKNQNQSEIILLQPEMNILSLHGVGILQMYDTSLRK